MGEGKKLIFFFSFEKRRKSVNKWREGGNPNIGKRKKKNQRQKLLIRCDLEASKELARLRRDPKKRDQKKWDQKKNSQNQCALAICSF
jgi:hypothetical protein